jgi:hypothetical protein
MRVIHFSHGATDPLWNPASGARHVPPADGFGATHVSCLHLEPRAKIAEARWRPPPPAFPRHHPPHP